MFFSESYEIESTSYGRLLQIVFVLLFITQVSGKILY